MQIHNDCPEHYHDICPVDFQNDNMCDTARARLLHLEEDTTYIDASLARLRARGDAKGIPWHYEPPQPIKPLGRHYGRDVIPYCKYRVTCQTPGHREPT